MSDPVCRHYRDLLGVYVVGAIEPSERSLLDAHLNQCYGCREELAGLAVLPAMLHRIPLAEAEELAKPGPQGLDSGDPGPQLLSRLLSDVRARRRSRRLRVVLAAAAAVIVAASGSLVVSDAIRQHPQPAQVDLAFNRQGAVSGTVKYAGARWGTEIWARVRGVPEWTECEFWVKTVKGRSVLVGDWLVGPGGGSLWYPSRTDVRAGSIRSFTVTSGTGKVLVTIPAT
jgi:Putative zinc-finger